jgi:hypothetical protein
MAIFGMYISRPLVDAFERVNGLNGMARVCRRSSFDAGGREVIQLIDWNRL